MNKDQHRIIEIIAVIVTALGKFLFYDILDQQLIFILLMFVFWGIYVSQKISRSDQILAHWGFRFDNFGKVFKVVLPYGIVAVLGCGVIGYWQNTINMHWHFIPIVILYPVFGVLQQFLLMSLFAGNLQDQGSVNKGLIILFTSVLFGLLHYPYWWLVVGTFLLSLFYSFVFLKDRNVYVLGIFHGFLGAVFYYTVVEKDPFVDVFGPIFN